MFTPSKLAVLFTAVLSVAAIPSHVVRNSLNHREIAGRVALPEAAPVAEIEARNMFVHAKRMMRVKRDETNDCEADGDIDVPPPTPKKDTKPTSSTPSEDQEVKPTSTPPQNLNVKPDPTTSTPTPSPTTPTNTGSGGGQTYTGQGTFYIVSVGPTACGPTYKDTDRIAAVSHTFFDNYTGYDRTNSNNNPLCGKTAKVSYKGKTTTVKLVDRCEGCDPYDLDFSRAAFNDLAAESVGRIDGVTWELV